MAPARTPSKDGITQHNTGTKKQLGGTWPMVEISEKGPWRQENAGCHSAIRDITRTEKTLRRKPFVFGFCPRAHRSGQEAKGDSAASLRTSVSTAGASSHSAP